MTRPPYMGDAPGRFVRTGTTPVPHRCMLPRWRGWPWARIWTIGALWECECGTRWVWTCDDEGSYWERAAVGCPSCGALTPNNRLPVGDIGSQMPCAAAWHDPPKGPSGVSSSRGGAR